MTATKAPAQPRTKRLHTTDNDKVLATRDFTYRASRYDSGLWQVEGPNGLSVIAPSKRAAKQAVHDHQMPKRSRTRKH
jgi:DNA-binding cell septation regulator SpoVG